MTYVAEYKEDAIFLLKDMPLARVKIAEARQELVSDVLHFQCFLVQMFFYSELR